MLPSKACVCWVQVPPHRRRYKSNSGSASLVKEEVCEMSPLGFTVKLIPCTVSMLQLHRSAARVSPAMCGLPLQMTPATRERGEAGGGGRTFAPAPPPGEHLGIRPSLTHAHLLALEQRRLRTQREEDHRTQKHKRHLQPTGASPNGSTKLFLQGGGGGLPQ